MILRRLAASGLAAAFLSLTVFSSGCGAGRRQVRKPVYIPPLAKAVIRTAKSYLPEEEKNRPVPSDCSDFVQKVFSEHKMSLPRTSVAMSTLGRRVGSSRDLRMGDLVFFSGERVSRIVGHVGIYVNNGVFIHLTKPELGVMMESMYSDYYRRRYLTARRIID